MLAICAEFVISKLMDSKPSNSVMLLLLPRRYHKYVQPNTHINGSLLSYVDQFTNTWAISFLQTSRTVWILIAGRDF